MITVYIKSNCPYSRKVIDSLKEHGVPFVEKNIADLAVLEELITRGGKRQVPFLEDDSMTPCLVDDDIEMYESSVIVEYIGTKYGAKNQTAGRVRPKLHVMEDSTCEACE